jgi:hypothetical protein
MKRIIIFSFIFILFYGCNENTVEPGTGKIVVRAYLYAGEPVTDVQITGTIPLGSEDTSPTPINNAEVSLLKGDKKYVLKLSAGDSGYYNYSGTDLSIQTGDVFQIIVNYNGSAATAVTEVPPAPENLVISPESFTVTAPTGGGFRFDTNRIELTWTKDTNTSFYVLIENIESSPEAISSGDQFMRGPERFLSMPVNTNTYRVSRMNITHYGRHRVRVYRINQEYADLYRSRQQDSRDLNEPLTNVQNGLGIFSAFNSVTGYFTVLKP